jgi:hypothetical protein
MNLLSLRLKGIPLAEQKLNRWEFVLQDADTKRVINIDQPWRDCFIPGQRVDMSMCFALNQSNVAGCPSCRTVTPEPISEQIDW